MVPGSMVYTLGCPLAIPFVIAQGLLGKASYEIDGQNYIMMTAPISSGNSGGPLVNKYGEVIGVNTLSSTEGQNVNYAVKIENMDKLDLTNPMSIEDFKDRFSQPVPTVSTKTAHVGDYILMGKYEQDNDFDNGAEDIEWLVVAEDGDELLVLSRFCLDVKCWNSDNEIVTWEDSEHRSWLNNEFYKTAFTASEKKSILYAKTSCDISAASSKAGNDGTYDRLFLLSVPELEMYMSDWSLRKALPSKYCKALGAGEFGNEYTFWFTRTIEDDTEETARYVTIGIYGDLSHDNPDGVSVVGRMTTRPAMWIKR